MKRGWFGPKAIGAFRGWPSAAPKSAEGWVATLVFIGVLAWAIVGVGLTEPARWVLGALDVLSFTLLTKATFEPDEHVY
jgi:hypothetical protein